MMNMKMNCRVKKKHTNACKQIEISCVKVIYYVKKYKIHEPCAISADLTVSAGG